jgi:hypothetical protein
MKKNTIIIILLIVLLYLIYILNIIYNNIFHDIDFNNCSNNYKINYKYYNDIKHNIKSGDLILFSSYSVLPISRIFKNTIFQHYGIVIRENDNLFCIECHPGVEINKKKYKNVFKTDLKTKLLYYPGNVYISHLNYNLNEIQEFELRNIDMSTMSYFNSAEFLLYFAHNIKFYSKNKFNCISFIFYILRYKINIINEDINNTDICSYITNLIINSNTYNYPYEIIHKELLLDKYQNKSIIIN